MKMILDLLSSSDRKNIAKLQKELDSYKKSLEQLDYTYEREEFLAICSKLWSFLSEVSNEKTFSIFSHSKYYADNRHFFISLRNYYIRTIGCIEACEMMTIKPNSENMHNNAFDQLRTKERFLQISRELKIADLSGCKNLVIVGNGPLPETILYIYENTKIKNIVCLDSNQEAIYIASELIKFQNIRNIQFMHLNGQYYDYKNADLIYLSNFCGNKKRVFERISKTSKPGVQIITRNPILFGKMYYEDSLDVLHPRLTLIKKTGVNKFFLFESLLITKLDI